MTHHITQTIAGLLVLGSATLSAQVRIPATASEPVQATTPVPLSAAEARIRLDQLVVEFDSRTERSDNTDLTRELRLLLTRQPELVPTVPEMLLKSRPASHTSGLVILALEQVGTPEAQAALRDVHADRNQAHIDRLRAAIAAGSVDAPTAEAVTGLWYTAQSRTDSREVDVSNTALLALGVAGSTLRLDSPEAYPAVRDGLFAIAHGTKDSTERVVVLKAIGNLGDESLGTGVSQFLFDPLVPVRAAAAQALGLMVDDSSRDTLLYVLENEPRGVVRSEIVRTLRKLPADHGSLRIVHQMVASESHVEARAMMVSYLVEHLDEFESARKTLQDLARNDATKRVRMLAVRAFQS